ncbi:uncharacterized protein LOC105700755 [Orussus abietinus]|uniref:uncharacterized protein LOC105700755 n=1 Tax=Orussus abietinus TaxID=222816 RepID=UPI000C715F7C|nr:uncharacterized protein LOC105700755 [Orussus abietinus]
MRTVVLACIWTLLPLMVALGIAFAIRHAWRKYRNRRNIGGGRFWFPKVRLRDVTTESLGSRQGMDVACRQEPTTLVLSAQDLVNGIDGPRYICEMEVMEEAALNGNDQEFASPGNQASKNANGNIITLTLKNNHLIVETEERAVTAEQSKTQKFEDNGCSFVVEVPPGYQSDDTDANKGSSDDVVGEVTDQRALVHREEIPEDRSSGFENAKLFGSTNTGLSQSDLSIFSEYSTNPSYRYGNQLEYNAGHFGYPVYEGYDSDSSRRLEGGSKWVEFDKSPDTEKTLLNESKSSSIEREASESFSSPERRTHEGYSQGSGSSEQPDSTDASNSTDTVRSNPNLQVNGTTPNKLEGMERKSLSSEEKVEGTKPVVTGVLSKDEVVQEEEARKKLGNGVLTAEEKIRDQKPEAN